MFHINDLHYLKYHRVDLIPQFQLIAGVSNKT